MPNVLIDDDTQQETTLYPAQALAQYLQDNWTITDPAVTDIVWQSYWLPTALATIAFREKTEPSPMTIGWHKHQYRSVVGIIISAWYEANGDYSTVVSKIHKRIEDLIHIDVTAMKNYGASVMRIIDTNDIVDYPKQEQYKDDVCDLLIEVELLGSKTVQNI